MSEELLYGDDEELLEFAQDAGVSKKHTMRLQEQNLDVNTEETVWFLPSNLDDA